MQSVKMEIRVESAASTGASTPQWNSQAVLDVAVERWRQMSDEGWTPKHDDEHDDGSLAAAAGCYARLAAEAVKCQFPAAWVESHGWMETQPDWPWEGGPKPAPIRRMLIKAAALILAEIERIDRKEGHTDALRGPDANSPR